VMIGTMHAPWPMAHPCALYPASMDKEGSIHGPSLEAHGGVVHGHHALVDTVNAVV
jgi:hypothetical protein